MDEKGLSVPVGSLGRNILGEESVKDCDSSNLFNCDSSNLFTHRPSRYDESEGGRGWMEIRDPTGVAEFEITRIVMLIRLVPSSDTRSTSPSSLSVPKSSPTLTSDSESRVVDTSLNSTLSDKPSPRVLLRQSTLNRCAQLLTV